MMRGLWSVAAILLAASAAWGQELTPLGAFTDVRSPDGGDHCSADFPPNRSLPAWCAFWRGVRRCDGVGDLCASRGIRP